MATIRGWLPRFDVEGDWLIRALPQTVDQHYYPPLGTSARCQSPGFCVLCANDFKLQRIVALPVSHPDDQVLWLMRLLAKDEHLIEWLRRLGPKALGQMIRASIMGYIDVTPIGRRAIPAVPVENYIAAIGRKAYSTAMIDHSSRPKADDSAASGARGETIDVSARVSREARRKKA